jgi:hypothetical protein
MNINKSCSLVIQDCYLYDIQAAYPQLLNNINWNFDNVDLKNKQERSEAIGIAQINNENLSSFLMNSAENLVDFYLDKNNVKEEEIILTQRDGFITTKILDNTDEFITMKYRGHISPMIISPDRNSYLSIINEEISVKGISHMYKKLDMIYNKFVNLNLFDKKVLFGQLDYIKKSFIESKNKELFMISCDDQFAIITKKYGNLIVQNSDIFDIEDINKTYYYEHYFMPFLKSIYLEYY